MLIVDADGNIKLLEGGDAVYYCVAPALDPPVIVLPLVVVHEGEKSRNVAVNISVRILYKMFEKECHGGVKQLFLVPQ